MILSGRLRIAARAFTSGFVIAAQSFFVGSSQAQFSDVAHHRTGLTLDEVVRAAVAHHVDVRFSIEAQRLRESELQTARGAFDTELGFTISAGRANTLFTGSDRERYGVAASESGLSSYGVRAARTFRSGLTISPGLEFVRQDDLTMPVPPLVRTQAALTVSYPLLGAGRPTSDVAALDAARLLSEASGHDLQYAKATAVHLAVDAYWSYLSAFESFKIHTASEHKAGRLVRETRALVDAGERPAGDLAQLQADLADRFAARLKAEHLLLESRQHLALQMGLSSGEAVGLAPPSTPFPEVQNLPPNIQRERLIATADGHRPDLKSARIEVAAAEAVRNALRVETRPSLFLRLDVGYAALYEHPQSVISHLPFGRSDVIRPYSDVSLGFDWPTASNRARGALARQEAAVKRARIVTSEIRRRTASAIRVVLAALRTTSAEFTKIDEAVQLYNTAVENEQKRLQLGMSTQINLLLVEERHRNALLSRLSIVTRYARSISRLRFETGTLLNDTLTSDGNEVSIRGLLSPHVLD